MVYKYYCYMCYYSYTLASSSKWTTTVPGSYLPVIVFRTGTCVCFHNYYYAIISNWIVGISRSSVCAILCLRKWRCLFWNTSTRGRKHCSSIWLCLLSTGLSMVLILVCIGSANVFSLTWRVNAMMHRCLWPSLPTTCCSSSPVWRRRLELAPLFGFTFAKRNLNTITGLRIRSISCCFKERK